MRQTMLACLLLVFLVPGTLTAGALSAAEQRLVAAIDEQVPAAEQLLRDAVAINSGTMNFSGVRAVGELFADAFARLGMTVEWIDGSAFDRAGHLVASRGSRGPRLLLIGHLDTVFPRDSAFQSLAPGAAAYEQRGPGITDMKGGNVIIVQALQALAAAGVLDEVSVRVFLAGDEEDRGAPIPLAIQALTEAAEWADYALGFEDGDSDPATAVIARRGSSAWRLSVSGKPAHSSQIFREDIGYGAAFELARTLDGWRSALAGEANLTFNPGLLLAGTEISHEPATTRGSAFGKDNVIAQTAVASGGIRALSPEQLDAAVVRMRDIADASLPHTHTTFTFERGYPPMPPTAGNRRLLARYSRASEDLGFGSVQAVDPRRAGAADISFTAALVDGALDGLGLMGSGGHTIDETADMRTLGSQAKRAALLIYRIAREQPQG